MSNNNNQNPHSIKNLKNQNGSIMFIVLATMTVLIVMAGVLLYTLNAEMQISYDKVKSEQAYQAALSVSDWLFDYFNTYTGIVIGSSYEDEALKKENELLYEMMQLELNGQNTLTTGKILFPVLNEYEYNSEYQYEIEIKRIEAEKADTETEKYFSFEITTYVYIGEESSVLTRIYSFNRMKG